MALQPAGQTATCVAADTGGLLPHLLTLSPANRCGYFLLCCHTLTDISPFGSAVPCVVRTFLFPPARKAIKQSARGKDTNYQSLFAPASENCFYSLILPQIHTIKQCGMGLIDKFKELYGQKQLKALSRKHAGAISRNYYDMHHIGIIYDAGDEESFKLVKSFVCKIKADNKEVMSLGYVNRNQLDDYHLQPKDFHFFCRKDLNWYQYPTEPGVKEFCETRFDVLIDLNMEPCLPMRFVLNESKAEFRVGRFTEKNIEFYDMLIDISSEPSLTALFEQSMHYLKMINKNIKI